MLPATPRHGARLSHVALRVRALGPMERFYRDVLGLSLSDEGTSARSGRDMVFLTADPAVHHQLALVEAGPGAAERPCVEHLAFEVENLAALRVVRDRARGFGLGIRTSNHGNAWAIYFADPEGNPLEVFAPAPFAMRQPFGQPFDLDQPDAAIIAATREITMAPG